ncbi:MAG: response regulator transcription factor [Synergistaceae bacterium]|nr:response regulator transcription factor [Synergistaceae bacterium]
MKLNIAVVDDTRLDSERLQRGISKWFMNSSNHSRNITCFADGESLLRVFEPEKFQIVFMDIIMQNCSGIDAARELRLRDNKALLIFTTASREYAFEAFPLHPFDYLIKPCSPDKLGRVLSEAVSYLETPEPVIDVRVSRSTYTLRVRDISAVMSRDHLVEVVLSDGRCILCSMLFREFEEALSGDKRFLLCNRGVLINMECVASLSRDKESFIMNDSLTVPIRVRGRAKVLADFTQYQFSRVRRVRT